MSSDYPDNSREISDMVDKIRIAGRRIGMHLYHKSTEFNYRKQLLSRERKTPAGSYQSFELVTGHKSDYLLSQISSRADSQDTIYDIGAYSGDYSIPLASDYPNRTVVAFEPDRVTRQRLAKNLDENSVKGDIIVEPYGLGSTSQYRDFYRSSFRKISSFNREDATRWGAEIIDTEQTQVRTMDEVSEFLPSPDHVKIDAEGYAPEVLHGSSEVIEDTKPIFYIEPHDREGTDRTESILKWCKENDYKFENEKSVILCVPR